MEDQATRRKGEENVKNDYGILDSEKWGDTLIIHWN